VLFSYSKDFCHENIGSDGISSRVDGGELKVLLIMGSEIDIE
jgi:hypothetical protein